MRGVLLPSSWLEGPGVLRVDKFRGKLCTISDGYGLALKGCTGTSVGAWRRIDRGPLAWEQEGLPVLCPRLSRTMRVRSWHARLVMGWAELGLDGGVRFYRVNHRRGTRKSFWR